MEEYGGLALENCDACDVAAEIVINAEGRLTALSFRELRSRRKADGKLAPETFQSKDRFQKAVWSAAEQCRVLPPRDESRKEVRFEFQVVGGPHD